MGVDVLPAWLEALGLPASTVLVARAAAEGETPDAETPDAETPDAGIPDAGIPDDADRTWCVVSGPEGWDVYWAEDGERWSWTRFDEESSACFHLFGRLAWTQMMRGALRLG